MKQKKKKTIQGKQGSDQKGKFSKQVQEDIQRGKEVMDAEGNTHSKQQESLKR